MGLCLRNDYVVPHFLFLENAENQPLVLLGQASALSECLFFSLPEQWGAETLLLLNQKVNQRLKVVPFHKIGQHKKK